MYIIINLGMLLKCYYTDSIIFLADNVDLADISHFFADNMMFFVILFQIWKSGVWIPTGPRGGAEAGAEPLGPVGIHTPDFQIWNKITKNIMLLSKEVRDTQPNPRYSAKNNDAIRMIASFMPIHRLVYRAFETSFFLLN